MTKNCKLEILRTLGTGGMATVYLARREDGGTSRPVAVKKLHPYLASDPGTLAVLEDEALLGASIRHPNVVSIIDFVRGDEPALIMEWIDGVDLGKLARAVALSGRRLPVDVVAAIARDVLAGLDAAHECRSEDGLSLDIVHRDVSPQNVLVGFDGVARVTDFGIAKAKWRKQYTEQGSIKGKLGYLAPEQLTGRCDRRTDIFGVGAVLWELLTGKRLRTGDGVEVLVEILCAQLQAPSVLAPEAACLDAVVMRALERAPDERFATAAQMLEAIEREVTVASPARVAAVVHEMVNGAEPVKSDAPQAESPNADMPRRREGFERCRQPREARREMREMRRAHGRRGRVRRAREDVFCSSTTLRRAPSLSSMPRCLDPDLSWEGDGPPTLVVRHFLA